MNWEHIRHCVISKPNKEVLDVMKISLQICAEFNKYNGSNISFVQNINLNLGCVYMTAIPKSQPIFLQNRSIFVSFSSITSIKEQTDEHSRTYFKHIYCSRQYLKKDI